MDYAWRNTDFGIPDQIGGLVTLNEYPYTDGGGSKTDTCEAANYKASVFLKEPRVVSESSCLYCCWICFHSRYLKPFLSQQCRLMMI